MNVTTQATRTVDVAKTVKRDDIVEDYTETIATYTNDAYQMKLQFFATYEKIDYLYETLTQAAKDWFADALGKLAEAKEQLIKLQPFQIPEVDYYYY